MADDEPFFEPYPERDEHEEEHVEHDWPWQPPRHVVGVVVPLDVTLHRDAEVAAVLTHAVAYGRGVELHVGLWRSPAAAGRASRGDSWHPDHLSSSRLGVRLADGTRLGHRVGPSPEDDADRSGAGRIMLTEIHGGFGSLSGAHGVWLAPIPDGNHLDVVVEWPAWGLPESTGRIPLAPLREAADRETVLWNPPPPPGEGWFGFAGPLGAPDWTMGSSSSELRVPPDDDAAKSGDDD